MIQYKPLEKNLEEGVGQLGANIRNIPHIVIGRTGVKADPNKKEDDAIAPDLPPPTSSQAAPDPLFTPKENDLINKVKKWALVAAVLLICGYAVWRILT